MNIQESIKNISTEEMATVINTFFLARHGEEINGEFVFPAKAERHAVAAFIAESLTNCDAGPLAVFSAIVAAHGTVYAASRKMRGKGGVYRSKKQLEQAQALQAIGLSDDCHVAIPFAFLSDVAESVTAEAKPKTAKAKA